ncbi:MAG: hypothetical protein J2P53_15600, partial [Bradyrhizobiaceae bacterium]|nr:hypothetical protein [Bradyrhizobiaceae bacterium]
MLGSLTLVLWRAPVFAWALAAAAATVVLKLAASPGFTPGEEFWSLPGWLPAIALFLFSPSFIRRRLISAPAYRALSG